MRLLLHEHISPRVAAHLREHGVDATAVLDPEYEPIQGRPDSEVLQRAAAEGRAVVTYNYADFAKLHGQWVLTGRHHGGIVLVPHGRVSPGRPGAQVRELALLAAQRHELRDQLVWLD